MECETEFNVREVRGKGFQIRPLSLPSDRMFWAAIGIVWGLTACMIVFRSMQSDRALAVYMVLVAGAFGYQLQHLWRAHLRFKRMLREIGMTEKEMLAKLNDVIAEAKAAMDAAEEREKQDGGR